MSGIIDKKNLLLAATLSVCFVLSGISANAATIITAEESITLPNETIQLSNQSGTLGGAIRNLGALNVNSDNTIIFEANKATTYGGAIYTSNAKDLTLNNVKFNKNESKFDGGAIYSMNSNVTIKNALFENNKTTNSYGGAIYLGSNTSNDIARIEDSIFENNSAYCVGAIDIANSKTIIDNVVFKGNHATYFGAIEIRTQNSSVPSPNSITEITNSKFIGNYATIDGGGAIGNYGDMILKNSILKQNHAYMLEEESTPSPGGAISLGAVSHSIIDSVNFEENTSATHGGAIGMRLTTSSNTKATLDILNSVFKNNTAKQNGGAIDNHFYNSVGKDGAVNIANTNFIGNTAGENGGAVYTEGKLAITDNDFINNSAGDKGGAIYTTTDLSIAAVTKNVVFTGNKATDGSDIFMNGKNSVLNLDAAAEKSITLASGVSGSDNGYKISVNENPANTGSVIVNSAIKNATINVENGTFHLAQGSKLDNSSLTMTSGTVLNTINNEVNTFDNKIILPADAKIAVDLNVATGIADRFANIQKVEIKDINPIGATKTAENNISINIADALGIDPTQMSLSEALLSETKTILTPIRYLKGGVSQDGIMSFAPAGNSYKDFNPSIMASAIAAQLGGYLTQLNSYDEAFRNMDMYMLMTKKQRQAIKLRNKYAAAEGIMNFDPNQTPYSDKAGWFRPYATFENVDLKGGPRVSNVAYGSFFGAESEMYDLGHGWDGMWGAYVGYNGSHQAYNGISMYQNGGTLGLVGMAYKGNFYTGLTINAGANGVEAGTMYGSDNFSMLMAGIASKTGYNIEMADGKFIIQPNFLMSYSFVNTFDYTNAAGVSIHSSPLNAIQIEPGIKFIGNLKNGWQPYLGVSMIWNIMDKTNFSANDISLPDLSIKPFVKYGIGVRKTWGERLTGFFQCYFTNGGRNGVGLQAGFRMTLGKTPTTSQKQNSTPQLKKTEIKLSSNR